MSGAGDFHSKPFDEGTKVKLRLFQRYLREWLPVFLHRGAVRINIVDPFAGPGQDKDGHPGSPLIALQEIREYAERIRSSGSEVRLLLNEKVKKKAAILEKVLSDQAIPSGICRWEVDHLPFEEAFDRYSRMLEGNSNLLFLDQSAMKFISDQVFSRIVSLSRTDFIFFIASSSLRRFGDHPSFRRHLRLARGAVSAKRFNDTHRQVTHFYKEQIPAGREYYLGSFSIKKGSNLYGLVFGSGHPRGLEKFLRACWEEDTARGEANFDIDDDDIDIHRPRLFQEMDKPDKVRAFEHQLIKRIRKNTLRTDREVYLFSIQEGCRPSP